MQGEAREELELVPSGAAGDRRYGVLDASSSTVLSAKREGRLFDAAAALRDGDLLVSLPSGQSFEIGEPLNEALTHWLGRPVRVVDAETFGAATYESPEDFERDESPIVTWEGPEGSFVDESPLHLLTSLDLQGLARERPDLQWDARRFRPNVVLEPIVDDPPSLVVGARVTIGECEIEISNGCTRCVMTTRAQPGSLDRQLDVLRHVARFHHHSVGVRAGVARAGHIRLGDPVSVVR